MVAVPTTAPPLCLAHLDRLTGATGIIQFADGDRPDPGSGCCVDDVARLGMVAADLAALGLGGELPARWSALAAAYLAAAYEPGGAGMCNMSGVDGAWLDRPHLGDHVGRAVWALGVLADTPEVPQVPRRAAAALLDAVGPVTDRLGEVGLRSVAYAVLGLARWSGPVPAPARVRRPSAVPDVAVLAAAVHRLDGALRAVASPGWDWFEPMLAYDNARLPQALLVGAARLGEHDAAGRALAALDWYVERVGLTTGPLRCVGNSWHHRDDRPADSAQPPAGDGDEQPLDAAAVAEALVDAWLYTRDGRYAGLARRAYGWFLGHNHGQAPLYDTGTGGCHDGLGPGGVNHNQGAESTLAYHQALLRLVRAGLMALPGHPTATRRP